MVLKKGSKVSEVKELQRLLHLYEDGVFGSLTEEAVKEFQKTHGLTPDGIVGDATWAKLKGDALVKSKRSINEIIVHCTATKEGRDYTTADIKRWHLERGYSDIGYHYIIYRDGSIHQGRNIDITGAHCKNHNAHSIGICYVGGLDSNSKAKDTRTDAQKEAMLKLITATKKLYPNAVVYGHCNFDNKDCPCFNLISSGIVRAGASWSLTLNRNVFSIDFFPSGEEILYVTE